MKKEEFEKIKVQISAYVTEGYTISSPSGGSGSLKIEDVVPGINPEQVTPTKSVAFVSRQKFTLIKVEPKRLLNETSLQATKRVKLTATFGDENGNTRTANIDNATFEALSTYGEKPFYLKGQCKAFNTKRNNEDIVQTWVCITGVTDSVAQAPENGAPIANPAQSIVGAPVTEDVEGP